MLCRHQGHWNPWKPNSVIEFTTVFDWIKWCTFWLNYTDTNSLTTQTCLSETLNCRLQSKVDTQSLASSFIYFCIDLRCSFSLFIYLCNFMFLLRFTSRIFNLKYISIWNPSLIEDCNKSLDSPSRHKPQSFQ